ncbi:MAG: DUF2177 family protein [Rhodoferax sp.]|nr:DUF2177 family protein [Rhodoferax sp.]
MTKFLAVYAATFVTMLVLDLLWLGVIARSFYESGIGHLMAEKPNIPVAALFYLLFPVGLVIFAVQPQAGSPGWTTAAGMAALFGFFAYATYDLTNLATLRDWPWNVALVDMAWGSAVSAASAAMGKLVLDRMAA